MRVSGPDRSGVRALVGLQHAVTGGDQSATGRDRGVAEGRADGQYGENPLISPMFLLVSKSPW